MEFFQLKPTLLLLSLSVSINGCISFSRDVSHSDSLWGGYNHQKEYKLLRDVFLMRVNTGLLMSKKLVLVPEGSLNRGLGRHNSSPDSIAEYKKTPKESSVIKGTNYQYSLDVVGIIPVGTRFKCTKLKFRSGWTFMTGSVKDLTPWAKILDGPFAGTSVDITDVSIYYRENKGDVFKYKPEEGVVALADAT